jgi:hypothetical protein
MAQDKRYGRVLLVVLIVATLIGTAVFVSTLFAQPGDEGPPGDVGMEPGMMGEAGMMDGMGGMGGASAGAALTWTNSDPMDEDLQMSYDEYLAQSGQSRAMIPDVYLHDADGVEETYSYNQWAQLHRIYSGRVAVGGGANEGRPGNALAARVNNEVAVKTNELETVQRVYGQGLDNFAFKVGFPQMESGQISLTSNAVSIDVGVIMSVRPNVAKRYPSLVYRALKKFDNYGVDRQIFRIVDYEGGVWNPKKVWLWNGAVTEWNRLWSANDIVLTLYDVEGDRIVSGRQSAQQDGGICAKLVHPDELNYAPMFETLMPAKDYTFEGGHLNLDYSRGWYYNFSFSIPLSQLAGLDRAEVQLMGANGAEGSRGETQAPAISSSYTAPAPAAAAVESDSSREAAQAGGEQAMDAARTGLPMMGQTVPGGFY